MEELMLVQNLGTKNLSLGLKTGSVLLKPTQACEMTEKEYKTLVNLFPCLSIVKEEIKIEGEPEEIIKKETKNGNKKSGRKNKK